MTADASRPTPICTAIPTGRRKWRPSPPSGAPAVMRSSTSMARNAPTWNPTMRRVIVGPVSKPRGQPPRKIAAKAARTTRSPTSFASPR